MNGTRVGSPKVLARRLVAASAGLLALGLLTGCRGPGLRLAMGEAQAQAAESVPTESSGALIEYIADQPYATAEPAYRAAYMLWRGEMFAGDFDALTAELESGKLIAGSWDHEPGEALTRSEFAHLLVRASGIWGGVNFSLTGLGRYAWRELFYLGIATPASPYGYVSGGQFVGMLTRAEQYVRGEGLDLGPQIELGAD